MHSKEEVAYNTIRVRYFAMLRDLVGRKEEDLRLPLGATVQDAIAALVERYTPGFKEFVLTADGQLRPRLTVLVNGEVVSSGGITQTVLPRGSELVILPPVGGGEPVPGPIERFSQAQPDRVTLEIVSLPVDAHGGCRPAPSA